MKITKTIIPSVIIVSLTNCGNATISENNTNDQPEPVTQVEMPLESTLENFKEEDVARFAISSIMGQPSKKIKVQYDNGLYYVSYIRKSDSKKFEYKINIDGNKVVWANIDGRWRDSEDDEIISFEEDDNYLKIIQVFSDGSSDVKKYKKRE